MEFSTILKAIFASLCVNQNYIGLFHHSSNSVSNEVQSRRDEPLLRTELCTNSAKAKE